LSDTGRQRTVLQCEVLSVSGQAGQCEVLTDSGHHVQCEVLRDTGQTVKN